jgi:D-alanyl-D-alanine carboxypeptidase
MKKILTHIAIFLIFALNSIAQAASTRKASLVVDLNNGKILHSENAHELRYPASLVKMMTLYLTFKQLNQGELSLDKKLRVSAKAASMPRTNLSLKAGSSIPVRKAILGLIIHSGNDAAVTLAEAISGSEEKFAIMMNQQAKKLGMHNTTFRNASGLPHKQQKSTAYDLAKLSIALKKDFPQYFPWFSVTSFSFNGKTYNSHNHVLINYEWATGLKTGFTNASGFNVATTAHKDGKHLVAVVLGEDTAKARDKLMVNLLNNGFKKNIKNTKAPQSLVVNNKKTSITKKKLLKDHYNNDQ